MKKKKSVKAEPQVESPAPKVDAARDERSNVASFPIVGVGASAGGLEAFTQLLKALPLDTGMGFVLVQHLDPEHESALTQILSRATSLPVCDVTNNQAVRPNCVYIIPPDTNLSIAEGMLKLQPRPKTRTPHRPIDSFFESLALDHRERAIGVVLSGTASDGTLGLEAIKAEGGITFAQDDSAKYDSMPRSAVAAGCVDLVLSPKNIAQELARIAKHPYVAGQPLALSIRAADDHADAIELEDHDSPLPARKKGAEPKGGNGEDEGYIKTLSLLRNHSGVDFSLYKSSTIQRRITRRLVINKQNTLEDYATFLKGNAKELDALCTDVLISVTSFFRNPEAFEALQRDVLPELLKQPGDDPIRVWVPGCSTGQEAYSIAIAFMESAEKSPRGRNLQVFATDLNEKLLDKARFGLYPKTLSDDISPERLRRFFVEEQGGYRVSKSLREMVVFARQNLFADPPFSRMDLISCRNLLIYLGPTLQKKAIPTFHYALKPGGFLLLGASESVGGFTELFEPVDRKYKIYSKKAAPTPAFHIPTNRERGEPVATARRVSVLPVGQPQPTDGFGTELSAQREADRITVNQFAPPGVLVNADLQVLQFRGSTGAFLEPPVGKASFNVLKMAREGLMLPLRAAINDAKKGNKTTRRDNVRVKQNGETRAVNLEIIPLKNLPEPCFLILFEEASTANGGRQPNGTRFLSGTALAAGNSPDNVDPESPVASAIPLKASAPPRSPERQESSRITELETELVETRDYLQTLQEQHEASSEELQAASEEVQSANEELQSINEELETSKEELESANEELTTVNDEMSHRNSELNILNNDLVNFQNSTRQVVLLLGRDLTIRRFSPQAEKQFDLLATDVGRPISHIRHNLVHADDVKTPLDLEGLCTEVITTVSEQEREVLDKTGRWHSLRVRPYTTLDHKIDGAVLLLLEIDELKQSEQAVAAARDYAENIVETVRDPLLVLDKDLRVESANRSFYRAFRVEPAETIGTFIYDLGNHQWDIPRLRELLEEILPQSKTVEDFEVEQDFKQLGRRIMLLNARRVVDPRQRTERILLAIEDITERKQAEAALQLSLARFEALFHSSPVGMYLVDAEFRIRLVSPVARPVFGDIKELIGRDFDEVIHILWHAEYAAEIVRLFRHTLETGEPFQTPERIEQRLDRGVTEYYEWQIHRLALPDGQFGVVCYFTDISARVLAEQTLRENEQRLRFVMDSMPQKIFTAKPNGDLDYFNPQWTEFTGMSFEQMRDSGWTRFVHPDDVDEKMRLWKHAFATGEPFQSEHRFRREDGEYRWHFSRAIPMRDETGRILMWVGSNTDIHDIKQSESALQDSEMRYRRLFEASKDGILILDAASQKITHVNPFLTKLLDYPCEYFVGKKLWEIGFLRDKEASHSAMQQLEEQGSIRYESLPLEDSHGLMHPVEMIANIYKEGEHRVVQCNIRDISERSLLEKLLRGQASELSDLHRRKDEFLAMLSHELRSPLAPIANAVELLGLQRGSETQIQQQARSIIQRQMGHLQHLVDDLLEVSRITTGRVQLRRVPVVVSTIVEGAVETVRPLIEQRRHELTVSLPPEPIWLQADAARLEQVLVNLLTNAAKYTAEGGHVWLTVELNVAGTFHVPSPPADGTRSVPATEVIIRVRDTGVGISPELLPHVFDLFTQAERSLDRSQGGLGIGLALVQRLTELHGGTVEAHSTLGQGSEFVVHLPLLSDEEHVSGKALAAGSSLTSRTSPLAPPLKVLVVDDNVDTVLSFSMLLKASGHEVRTAHDGPTAVQVALDYQPDVVLLDIGLPGLNGYQVAKRIRQEPNLKNVVLVALTGYGQEADRQTALEAGFNHHLVKPARLEQLQKILATVSVSGMALATGVVSAISNATSGANAITGG